MSLEVTVLLALLATNALVMGLLAGFSRGGALAGLAVGGTLGLAFGGLYAVLVFRRDGLDNVPAGWGPIVSALNTIYLLFDATVCMGIGTLTGCLFGWLFGRLLPRLRRA